MKLHTITGILFGATLTLAAALTPALADEDYCKAAQQALKAGDMQTAITSGQECLKSNPDDFRANYTMAKALVGSDRENEAVDYYKKAIEAKPGQVYALNNLGLIYIHQGKWESAEEVLTKAAEQNPDMSYVFNNLGVALERLEKYRESADAYAKAIEKDPENDRAKESLERVRQKIARSEAKSEEKTASN